MYIKNRMNFYQSAMQFLATKGFRSPITSGDNDKFISAYRKGDITENDLFKVKFFGAYDCERGSEEELFLLFVDGKFQGDKGKYTFFSRCFFVPTPVFIRSCLEMKI